MLKKLVKVLLVISLLVFFIPVAKDMTIKNRIKSVIKNNNVNSEYSGFIYIPKFDYKNLIKKGDKALDENYISMHELSSGIIDRGNIILSGHNNKYVFHKLYKLNIGDEIIISDFNIERLYAVEKIIYTSIDDSSIFDKDNKLTLITCTNNSQKRLVVICTEK